jgi:hypothetical protein
MFNEYPEGIINTISNSESPEKYFLSCTMKLLLKHGFHFILVCKPTSHKTLYQVIDTLEQAGKITTFFSRKWNG